MRPEKEGLPERIIPPEKLAVGYQLLELVDREDFADVVTTKDGYSGTYAEGAAMCYHHFGIDPQNILPEPLALFSEWLDNGLRADGLLPPA